MEVKDGQQVSPEAIGKIKLTEPMRPCHPLFGLLVIIHTRQYSAHAACLYFGHETREANFILRD